MAFEATKREWGELYAFFKLLADGGIYMGTSQVKRNDDNYWPIAMIQREEHNGTRRYFIKGDDVRIRGEKIDKEIPRKRFEEINLLILAAIKSSSEDMIVSPEGVEEFLDEISLFDLEAHTDDRTDISVAFWNADAPLVGLNIRSRLGKMNPLLDGGRAANVKYELTGVKFAVPMVNQVNAIEGDNEIVDRMLFIERLGGVLKYADIADRVFRSNLLMIDLHFPRLLAEMLRISQLDGITRISELTESMKNINPLKIKDELINKHGFYEFKVKQFLMTLALGMRPAKIYNGTDSAVQGIILVNGGGELLCYHKSLKKEFEDFLFYNTRLEKGSTEKDKHGFLERENGIWYFRLNAKIGLIKR